VNRKTLTEGRVSRARNALEARDEVDLAISWDIEGQPRKLGGRQVDAFVRGQKVRLGIFVIR
jgi:hypothetical protein